MEEPKKQKKHKNHIAKVIGTLAACCTIFSSVCKCSHVGIDIKLDDYKCDDSEYTDEDDNDSLEQSTTGNSISDKFYAVGQKVMLDNVEMYAAANFSLGPVKFISGNFYIYDGLIIDGFIRICSSPENVGKKPLELNVTGWIKISDLN